jgi:hypothetical protein
LTFVQELKNFLKTLSSYTFHPEGIALPLDNVKNPVPDILGFESVELPAGK